MYDESEDTFWGCPDCKQEPYWCHCSPSKPMVKLRATRTVEIVPVGTYVHIDAGTLNLKRLRRQDRRRRLWNRLLRRPNRDNDFQVLDINNLNADGNIHITMRQDTNP